MIVYGSSLSPFVRKTLVAAEEKGLTVEHKVSRPGDPDPDFIAASPFRKIPGFRDGDFSISDSSAIIHYFEATKPDPALIPAEARARARTIWFEEFADTILVAAGTPIFFNRFVARLMGLEGDEAAAQKAERETLPPIYDYLETVVPEDGFLVGEGLTLADIAVAAPFPNLKWTGGYPDAAHWPKLAAYVGRILGRPSFAGLVEKDAKAFDR